MRRDTLVSERKLTKTVISSKARNLIVLKIQALKISPYGRNDKKRGFRSGTNYVVYYREIDNGIEIVRVLHAHMEKERRLET